MNYIQRLTQDNIGLAANIASAAAELQDFRTHLLSVKFQGTDIDGDRKDWIATADVLARISSILSTLQA